MRYISNMFQQGLQGKFYPVESPLPKERLPPEPPIVLQDAEIRWGKPSNFSYGTRKGPHFKYSVSWKYPSGSGDEGDEEEPAVPTLNRTEVEGTRKVSKIRITAEGDPDVWVDVERIDAITFQGPLGLENGTIVNFHYVLKHPS